MHFTDLQFFKISSEVKILYFIAPKNFSNTIYTRFIQLSIHKFYSVLD